MHYFVFIFFATILKRKRKLVALLLSYRCIVTITILWLFHTVAWVGLQYVTVVFPDHTHLLFEGLSTEINNRPRTPLMCYLLFIILILKYSIRKYWQKY